MKKFRIHIISAAVVISGLFSFSFVESYFEVSKNLDIFTTLFRELNVYYVDETDPGDLMKKGIDAMLESLDPYTNYIPESEIEDYRFMTTGQYGGIGSLIRTKDEYAVISEPYEGYPAHKADLRAGDIILEINGVNAKGKNTNDISKILKGTPKTTVKLLIKRAGEVMEKTLVREEIKINSVSYYGMLDDKTGYIKLTGFTDRASKEVKDALTELKEKHDAKSIILDLRGNPGGLLNESVNIVNLFVDKGKDIVSTKGKVKEWEKTYKALNNPVDVNIPLVVLVNSSSASASEIVSGAIQDLDRGVVIGQKTFGKGLVQTTRPLTYNAQLKVTTAKYYIPSGRCIQALDYSHRNEDGSVGHIPDSLINTFKTSKGRPVKDGGGVMPDIALEPKVYSNIAGSLLSKSYIFEYATQYRIKHDKISGAKDFRVTDTEYNEFVRSLEGKEYSYTTKSEKTLEDLKASAEKEKYYEDLKAEYEALKAKMIRNKSADLTTFSGEIKELLEEEIVSRYYFQKGRLEAGLKYDPEIRKALEVVNNQEVYASILNGTYSDAKTAKKQ